MANIYSLARELANPALADELVTRLRRVNALPDDVLHYCHASTAECARSYPANDRARFRPKWQSISRIFAAEIMRRAA